MSCKDQREFSSLEPPTNFSNWDGADDEDFFFFEFVHFFL